MAFVESTCSDILKDFGFSGSAIDLTVSVLRIGFGFAIVFSYPVVLWEARVNLSRLIFGRTDLPAAANAALNLALVASTTVVGVLVPRITDVLDLVGSTCSPAMIFILPALFYLRSMSIPLDGDGAGGAAPGEADGARRRDRAAALLSLGFGTCAMVCCLTLWTLKQTGVYQGRSDGCDA
jgi:hypothetical protein